MNSRVLPILALMISVAIFFAYINPTWKGPIAATKFAIENNVQALIAADEYDVKRNELSSARDQMDPANLARLDAFLPDSVDNVGLILDINALAVRSGLLLSSIDVTKSDPGSAAAAGGIAPEVRVDPVGFVDLSLSAVGTYRALQAFLIGIERSARLLDIQDITVSGSDTGVYSYQMTVRIYWLR